MARSPLALERSGRSHILDRASTAGLSWPLPDDLDDEALRAQLYPSPARDGGCVQPDWEAVLGELRGKRKRRRARLTRRQLWVEYRDEVPGFRRSGSRSTSRTGGGCVTGGRAPRSVR